MDHIIIMFPADPISIFMIFLQFCLSVLFNNSRDNELHQNYVPSKPYIHLHVFSSVFVLVCSSTMVEIVDCIRIMLLAGPISFFVFLLQFLLSVLFNNGGHSGLHQNYVCFQYTLYTSSCLFNRFCLSVIFNNGGHSGLHQNYVPSRWYTDLHVISAVFV